MSGEPNYLKALLEHLNETDQEPGSVRRVEVRHDSWCSVFEGGVCDCEPEVETGKRVEERYSEEGP